RLPQTVHGAFRHLADQLFYIVGLDATRGKTLGAVNVRVCHGPARVGLKRERFGDPTRAEVPGECVIVSVRCVRKPVEQPIRTLEHSAWSEEAATCKQRRPNSRLRRQARMQPFGSALFAPIFDGASGHAGTGAEYISALPLFMIQCT